MTTSENDIFSVIAGKFLFSGARIDFWWGGNKNLVGGVYWGGGFFQVGGEMSKFLVGGEDSSHPPSKENPAPCPLINRQNLLSMTKFFVGAP